MAREIIDEAIVLLELENRAGPELAAAVEEYKAEIAALGREKAQIKITSDLSQLRRDLAEARAGLKDLEQARKSEQALNERLSAQAKSASTRRLNDLKQEIAGEKEVIRQVEQEILVKARLAATTQSANRAAAQIEREKTRAITESTRAVTEQAREIERATRLQLDFNKAKERAKELERAAGRTTGTEKLQAQLDQSHAIAQMELLRTELAAMGRKPIPIKADVELADRNAVYRLGHSVADAFGFTKTDQVRDFTGRLRDLGSALKDTHVNVGPFSTSIAGLGVALGSLAPIITGLVGALGSLVSVLGSGIGGAAGIGATALTGFGMAAIGILTSVKPFITSLGLAKTAIQAHNLAIAKYGENSKQGQKATKIFNNEIAALPPTVRNTVTVFEALKQQWQGLTQASANRNIGNIIGATFKTVRADMGIFASGTNLAFQNVAAGWSRLMTTLRSRDAQRGINEIFQNFDKSIPAISSGIDHLVRAAGRMFAQFSNFLPGLARGFSAWAANVDSASQRSDGFVRGVSTMVNSMRDLGHFIQAAGRFLFTFFEAGVKPGEGLLDGMTASLNRLTAQMETTGGQTRLQNFFSRSITTTKQLWGALEPLISAFVQFSQAMAPVAQIALSLISLFTRLISVLVGFKPLQYFAGFALAATFFGRMTSGLREVLTLMGTLLPKFVTFVGLTREMGVKGAWQTAFPKGPAATPSAEMLSGGMVAGAERSAPIVAGGMVTGAKEAALILARTETAGGAVSGVGAFGPRGAARAGTSVAPAVEETAVATTVAGAGRTAGSLLLRSLPYVGIAAAIAAPFTPQIIHAVSGAFHTLFGRAPDWGKQLSYNFVSGFNLVLPQAKVDAWRKQLDHAINQLHDAQAGTPVAPPASQRELPFNAKDPTKHVIDPKEVAKSAFNAAWVAVNSFKDVWSRVQIKTTPGFIDGAISSLKSLSGVARQQGVDMMVKLAAAQEASGQLPKNATMRLVDAIKQHFHGLAPYIANEFGRTGATISTTLKLDVARRSLAQSLNEMRAKYGIFTGNTKVDNAHIESNFNHTYSQLARDAKSQSGKARDDTLAAMKQIRDGVGRYLGQAATQAEQKMIEIASTMDINSASGRKAVESNFDKIQGKIRAAMRSGAVSSGTGIKIIAQNLNAALKLYGAAQVPLSTIAIASPQQLDELSAGISQGAVFSRSARGGMYQIGQPGKAGQDRIPLNVAGVPIIAGEGETAAIFTRHQIAAANKHLAHIGGLAGLFNRYDRPHAMAQGGVVVQGPVSTFGPPGEAAGGTAFGRSSADPGISLRIPGTHWNDPRNRALMGHVFRVSIGGHAANLMDIDLGPNEWTGRDIDVTGAGARVMGIDPGSFPTGVIGTAIMLGGNAALGAVSGAIQSLRAPRVKGAGSVSRIVQAGLNRVTKAANAFLARHAPQPSISGSAAVGPASGPAGLATFEGVTMAKWIANELAWATQHGWRGQPTSGYRPGRDPHTASGTSEHQGTQYPHGAVDFGGYNDPHAFAVKSALVALAARLNYPGPRLIMPIGFHDDGHLSGTGHARGGFVSNAISHAARRHAPSGGTFNAPTLLVGEQNSREYVIPTNPAYRHAATGYLADAAAEFGMEVIQPAQHGIAPSGGSGLTLSGATPARPGHRRRKHPHPRSVMLPAKDRLGGIGTDDISTAIDNAQKAYENYHQKVYRTGHKASPTEKANDKRNLKKVRNLQSLLRNANRNIADFTNLETEISLIGQYMDIANADPNDLARGYDPVTGRTLTHTWEAWKTIRSSLESSHTRKLRLAFIDAKRRIGDNPNAQNLTYILQLSTALGQSVADQQALAADARQAMSLDDFISSIGAVGTQQELEYAYSLAQSNNVPDAPGTPVREDLVSLQDDLTAAANLTYFYRNLLTRAQGVRINGQPNYPLMTEATDAFNAAQSTWQGIQDQFAQAAANAGPSQQQLFGTALGSLLSSFASNTMSTSLIGSLSGAAASAALTPSVSSFTAGTSPAAAPAGNTYTLHNYFQTAPTDPHLWSKSLQYELNAL